MLNLKAATSLRDVNFSLLIRRDHVTPRDYSRHLVVMMKVWSKPQCQKNRSKTKKIGQKFFICEASIKCELDERCRGGDVIG